MKTYIQYDEAGTITALVESFDEPESEFQIEVQPGTEIVGKRLNIPTLELEDDPEYLADQLRIQHEIEEFLT